MIFVFKNYLFLYTCSMGVEIRDYSKLPDDKLQMATVIRSDNLHVTSCPRITFSGCTSETEHYLFQR